MEYRKLRAIISGGGTGGHIFPAISIANKLKEVCPETEILFVGAKGRMEMEKVPAAGYKIEALEIAGLQRKLSLANLKLPFKVIKSIRKAKKIIRDFKPDVVIGVGGYASAPTLWAAEKLHIPVLIQEQNGYAGLTNKIVGKKADSICVAYDGMDRFFPADRIIMSGNPIRKTVAQAANANLGEALEFYGLNPKRKHIFIVGGSLGSRTLNESMKKWIQEGCTDGDNTDIIWQCGKYYKQDIDEFMSFHKEATKNIHHYDFISRMDLAYRAADLVISRSGASSVSELCAAGKACIFVPSPNVAEDHQTHNAMALVNKGAAEIITDAEAPVQLLPSALALLSDERKLSEMRSNIAALALPDADLTIINEIYRIVDMRQGSKDKND